MTSLQARSSMMVAVFLATVVTASAGETRFELDSSKNLTLLARTGQPSVATVRTGNIYRTDASAVISVDPDRLWAVSKDYDRYVSMGMPYLRVSTLLDETDDVLHTWNWMEITLRVFGAEVKQVSKHCYEVRLHDAISRTSKGSEWYLHPCPAGASRLVPASARKQYRDDPAFSRMDGSWYIRRLKDAPNGQPRVYVRYFLEYAFRGGIPNWVIDKVAKDELNQGVRDVILTLAREAGSQR